MPTAPMLHDISVDAHAAKYDLTMRDRDYLLTRCWLNRRGHKAGGIVWHIQDGRTSGSLNHFVHGHYANGDKVSASCNYTINRDGSILRVIPERHAPWTNGAVRQPSKRGRAFADRYTNPNEGSLTIEMEGFSNQAITEAQLLTALWLQNDLMRRHNLSMRDTYEHADFDTVERKHCAGPYYDRLRDLIVDPVKQGYTSTYGRVVEFHSPLLVTTTNELHVRQWGDTRAAIFRTDPPGSHFWAKGFVYGEDVAGEDRWYIEACHQEARRWAGATNKAGL